MKIIGGVFGAIILIFLLLGPFRTPIIDGIKGWRSSDTSQNFIVATGGGVTSYNVTLSHDLYQANVAEVTLIISTLGEIPAASSYDEATKKLLVDGLTPSESRTLTIDYSAETDDQVMQVIGPFLALLVFGGIIGAIAYGTFHKGR